MINFASLFGGFSRGASSAINDLLEKRGTNLDQLLDMDTFPNEYKSGNSKIMDFMNYSKYQELIHYVTVQGSPEDEKKGFKFPMVAADILSSENNAAIDFILPDGEIEVEVEYKETGEIQIEVDDDEQQYLNEQKVNKEETHLQESTQDKIQDENATQAKQSQGQSQEQSQKEQTETPKTEVIQEKKKKIIKEQKVVSKTRKEKREPLIAKLLSYYEGPMNYTLAGYNCKVLSMLFTKKPTNFLNFFFNSQKNYVEIVCSQIESKSVGDLITKILIWENTSFIEERKRLYDHLIDLMSEVKESHIISNLAYTLSEIIEKSSTYIKSKPNIANNQDIIQAFLSIFYRTQKVHKIINNAMDENENRSGYNCLILHAYLHHTQIETVNGFQIEEALESFITKAAAKLRNIPNRKTLGMGRVKIIEIFSFLIRKQRKTIEEDSKDNEMTSELIEELYVHTLVSQVTDFFTILFKLVQSFENNNILHNQVFKIIEHLLKEPYQHKSALQQLLLSEENVLLNFIIAEAEKDKATKTPERPTKRKGYIGHVINICKLIDQINNNELLNQRIKKTAQFKEILDTLIAPDIIETNKSLAGYQMKKNPNHEIMFQKQDILAAYAGFLQHCPKPQFEPEEPESSEDEVPEPIIVESETESIPKPQQSIAEKQLQEQERDEQKFNQVAAVSEQVDESNPKFWITHMKFDVEQLIDDVL